MTIQAARLLDDAGFEDAAIVLSSDLDELVIWQILSQLEAEAGTYGLDSRRLIARMTFGVGTRLISSHGAPALGGVYKLVAIRDEHDEWRPAIKLSETAEKMPIPGEKDLVRIYDDRGLSTADVVARAGESLDPPLQLFHPHRDLERTLAGGEISETEPLLTEVFSDGKRKDGSPDLQTLRERRRHDLDRLDPGVRRLVNPHIYHVSLTRSMKELQLDLITRFRAR